MYHNSNISKNFRHVFQKIFIVDMSFEIFVIRRYFLQTQASKRCI